MKYLLLISLLVLACGCSSTTKAEPDDKFTPVEFNELTNSLHKYNGKKVVFDAYVLGSEYNPSENDRQFFVVSLSDQPCKKTSKAGTLLCPGVKNKIRAAEDGYNSGVIKNSYMLMNNARKLGQLVTVYAECQPNREFYYYGNGIDLYISKVKVGETTVNTDYADKSKMAAEAPGYFKSMYQGGKKLFDLAKKLRP
ncbi:MAG: hypothetical protein NE327_05490 [Lentisphaeraceae bacterium]|nr:hypothetical protein [Lentisphaeraceae bacterium]